MIDINLLPPAIVLTQKEKAFRGQLLLLLIGLTILVGVVSFALFGGRFFFDSQLSSQQQRKNQLLNEFSIQEDTAKDLRTLKDKVMGVKIIQDSRTNFASMAATLGEVTTGTTLKSFIIDSDGRIRFLGMAGDLQILDSFTKKISAEDNNPFSKTVMSGLRREPGGEYSYTMEMQFVFSKPK